MISELDYLIITYQLTLRIFGGRPSETKHPVCTYLIFVTGTTGGARVKNSVQCKIFQIERGKMHILHYWGGIYCNF